MVVVKILCVLIGYVIGMVILTSHWYSRIKKVDAEVKSVADDGFGGAFVQRPVVHGSRLAEAHTAYAELGNFDVRFPQFRIFHGHSPFTAPDCPPISGRTRRFPGC